MRLNRSFILSLIFVLIISITLTGCKKSASKLPQSGSAVTVSMFSSPKCIFNPVFYEDQYDAYILNYTFDSMWGYDEKLRLSTDKYLAEKWEFSGDKKSITIYMKKNKAKWHDGKPVTIDDLIFSWEVLADKEYKGVRFSNVAMIKGAAEKQKGLSKKLSGVTKIDDFTVKVDLVKPQANLLSQLWSTPIPKHVFENMSVKEMKNSEYTKSKVIGNGPFKVAEVKPNEYVVVERFDDYYRKKAKLNKIVLKVVNQEVAVGALKRGDIDFLTQIAPKEFDELSRDSKITVKEDQDFSYQYLGFNLKKPKLQNVKLRQAITYAIDRQAMVAGLLKGHGYVLNQHMPKRSWAYNKSLENSYAYDVEKAKKLLAEAGYKDVNGDGFVEDPNGKALVIRLDYPTGDPVREKSAPIIAENLKKAGINVDLQQPREQTTHYDNVRKGEVDMFLAGWVLVPDPDPTGVFFSTDVFNMINYVNPESDKLITEAVMSVAAFDQDKRKEMYDKWTKLIHDDAPQVFLYGQNRIEAWNNRVQGVTFNWRGAVESPDVVEWWIQE